MFTLKQNNTERLKGDVPFHLQPLMFTLKRNSIDRLKGDVPFHLQPLMFTLKRNSIERLKGDAPFHLQPCHLETKQHSSVTDSSCTIQTCNHFTLKSNIIERLKAEFLKWCTILPATRICTKQHRVTESRCTISPAIISPKNKTA